MFFSLVFSVYGSYSSLRDMIMFFCVPSQVGEALLIIESWIAQCESNKKSFIFMRWSSCVQNTHKKKCWTEWTGTERRSVNWIEWMNETTDDDDSNLLTLFRNQFIHHKKKNNIRMWITSNEIIYLRRRTAHFSPFPHSLIKTTSSLSFHCRSFCISNP